MEWLRDLAETFLHLDEHLKELIRDHGAWVYGILFAIVFAETGLVIFPFLPGDSLLFTAGVLSHSEIGGLNVWTCAFVFVAAALLGDNVNYFIGRSFGRKLFRNPSSKVFKAEHLAKTRAFMERHGPKALIIARFVPIVRTFMPFVAGMGEMEYAKFIKFSVVAALIWVLVCLGAGYAFGNIPVVKENFEIAILSIIAVTLIPVVVEFWRHRKAGKAGKGEIVVETVESNP